MFDHISYINNNTAEVKLKEGVPLQGNIMNMHVMFEDEDKKILGEVEDITKDSVKVNFLGEIVNGKFVGGVIRKPKLTATIRVITQEEVKMIVGVPAPGKFLIGYSPLYDDQPIYVDINDLFSNHLAIFGNTGSGKSCGVARILQNVFENDLLQPYRANFFIFDAYGEYHNAFSNLNQVNPNYFFKFYTTNERQTDGELLRIPLWLLDVDDWALLLRATNHSQIPIIERMLKLTRIFSEDDEQALKYKNHAIVSIY